jgi:hypothetical protein
MTNRILSSRGIRLAALAATLSMLLGAVPVHAASAIDIEARALVAGRYEVGGWMALSVTLVNDGEPTEGYLTAGTEAGVVRRFVEMPAGARKVVMLYVQPEAFQRQIGVSYDEPNGTATATIDVQVLEQSDDQVAVVGDGTGTLRPQLLGSGDFASPEPLAMAPADIPERPEPLAGLSAIVWAGDSAGLGEAQRRALERWVGEGGQLVILGGPDWQARTSSFAAILPLEGLGAIDAVPQASLAAWSGQDAPALETATVSTGTLRAGARALVTAEGGEILASMRPIGAGRVILIGADLATQEYRGWEGAPRLWGRMLPTNAIFEQFMGGGFPIDQQLESAMSGALATLPTLDVPPAELLLVIIVGYILLIGPISYLVLRRIDRRELAWVTAPILIVLFSACSYGVGRTLKGGDVVVNQITLIRTTSEGGTASVDTYAGIFSPDRTTYDLSVDADALLGRLARSDGQASTPVDVEQGNPARMRELAIGVFGFEGVRAAGVVEHEPTLSVTWTARDGDAVGTVTNTSDTTISDVAYISSSGGERIGDLAPGASAEFTIPSENFNGSSAADQVYGFGGFDASNEEQRRISVRRQVIDALVGFAGWDMGGFDVGRRGPYVIGWREEAGPMPVSVDGLNAQTYASSVEVLSVRPSLGTGQVTIEPHSMLVDIVSTEGDANSGGPGMIILGEGSVVYSVALPLEAADMSPTSLEILVGPDPSMVLGDQGGFGGFWPAGFTVEVRHPTSGEWTLLGDLSQTSRFDIADPATAMSETGRIMVRITGVAADPQFGQQGVFVSAEVSGVIDE